MFRMVSFFFLRNGHNQSLDNCFHFIDDRLTRTRLLQIKMLIGCDVQYILLSTKETKKWKRKCKFSNRRSFLGIFCSVHPHSSFIGPYNRLLLLMKQKCNKLFYKIDTKSIRKMHGNKSNWLLNWIEQKKKKTKPIPTNIFTDKKKNTKKNSSSLSLVVKEKTTHGIIVIYISI